jgi:uncharacterized Zn finger protein (UPF0148 family)
MEPEIARRCPDCGASVRGGSFFCPQCGRKLKTGASNAGPAVEAPEMPARRKTDPGEISPTLDASTSANGPASIVASAQSVPALGAEDEGRTRSAVVISQESDDDGRSKRQRMTAAARDAFEEKLSPRVEKLRHASNVMLEEAAYDPSLRFVLVAVALVLLSLLILLLNYLLG